MTLQVEFQPQDVDVNAGSTRRVPTPGPQGEPGVSPVVSVSDIPGGHRVTITDEDHPEGQSFDVMDGEQGDPGTPGQPGPAGPAGPGVPNGGTTGQALVKNSNANQDTKWKSLSASDVGALPTGGGTMSGAVAMGGYKITGLGAPQNDGDAATKKYVDDSVLGIGTVFTIKGDVAAVADLPATGNAVGDVYYVQAVSAAYVWLETTEHPAGYWEEFGEPIDLSGYIEKPSSPTANQYLKWNGSAWVAADAPVTSVNGKTGGVSLDASDVGALANDTKYAGSATAGGVANKTASIPFGALDGASTATVMKATVPGITELRNGVCMLLKNGVVTSASGVTLNINNLGAKPIYYNMAAATALTTVFNINYTLLFVYDEDRVAGGCWVAYYGYYTSTNTIGYQLRTNKTSLPMSDKVYRYRLLFTSPDGKKFVPANTSTSTDATTSKTPITRPIDPFGRITYYGTTTAVNAGSRPGATYLWDQYEVVLGYSFNNTGAALTLTSWEPVYLKCAPQADGSAIIDATTPYVQSLPSTADGKIYIFLGIAYDATHIELYAWHPVYYYDGGGIRLWTNPKAIPSASSATPAALGTAAAGSSNDYARADHVHAKPTAADIGASPEPFVVTLTPTNADLSGSMNKTPAEIWDAYQAGKQIIFYVPMLRATAVANEYIEYDLNSDGENDAVEVYAYFPYIWMDDREVYVTLYTDLSTSIYGIVTNDFAAVVVNSDYWSESEPDVTILPCPMTYDFGECDELTVSPSMGYQGQYHFSFSCPAGTPTVLTMTGITGEAGDTTLEAGAYYEVDVWNGIAMISKVEVTAV